MARFYPNRYLSKKAAATRIRNAMRKVIRRRGRSLAWRPVRGTAPNQVYAPRRMPRLTANAPILYKRDGGSGYLTYQVNAQGGNMLWTPDGGTNGTFTIGSSSPYASSTVFSDVVINGGMTTYGCPFTMRFSPSHIKGVSEFLPLWESMKIIGVTIRFIPQFTKGTMYDSAIPIMPTIVYRTDQDDVLMPAASNAGVQAMLECSKRRVVAATRMSKVYVKPKTIAVTADVSENGQTSVALIRAQKIVAPGWERLCVANTDNTVSPSEYIGVKGYFRNLPAFQSSAFSLIWRVEIGYSFMLRTRT